MKIFSFARLPEDIFGLLYFAAVGILIYAAVKLTIQIRRDERDEKRARISLHGLPGCGEE